MSKTETNKTCLQSENILIYKQRCSRAAQGARDLALVLHGGGGQPVAGQDRFELFRDGVLVLKVTRNHSYNQGRIPLGVLNDSDRSTLKAL